MKGGTRSCGGPRREAVRPHACLPAAQRGLGAGAASPLACGRGRRGHGQSPALPWPPPSPSPPGRPPLRAPPPRRRRHSWPPECPPHTRAAQSRGAAYAVPSLSWDAAGKGRSGCAWCDPSGLTRVSRSGHGWAGGSSRERGAASGPARLSRSSGRRPAWTHGGPRCGAAPGRGGTARPGRSECRGKQGGREWGVWDGAVPRWVFADSHRRPVLPGSCCTLIPSPGFPQSCPTCTPICHHPIFGIFSFLLLRLLAP